MIESKEASFKEAYKQAEKEIPEKWYENRLALVGIAMGVTTLSVWSKIFASESSYAPNLAGGAIYGIGALADILTTIKDFSAQDKGDQKGFPRTTVEANPFLHNVVTADDYRSAWKTILTMEAAGSILATVFPDIGIGIGAGRLVGAMGNHRKTLRHERALELATKK